jgi:uncharacterized protein YijF (DUF1287 family)
MNIKILFGIVILMSFCQCKRENVLGPLQSMVYHPKEEVSKIENPKLFGEKLSNAALSIIDPSIVYISDYVSIGFPNGDVPAQTGVCSDVVIRALRKLGKDIQKEVHEDMKSNFSVYPKRWGLKTTDTNIDHRRVPNLEVFFVRKGLKLPKSNDPNHYKPGDIVTWLIGGKMPHIGIVTHLKSDSGTPLVVHNAGWGQVLEDWLFLHPMVGHYRYME